MGDRITESAGLCALIRAKIGSVNWWQQLIATISSATVVVGAVAWLIQSLIGHFLNKDVETHKMSLSKDVEAYKNTLLKDTEAHKIRLNAETSAEIERLKNDLQKVALEHQITFGALHAERAALIKRLNESLFSLFMAVREYGSWFKGRQPEEAQEKFGKVQQIWGTFFNDYNTNRIFLSQRLCERIDDLGGKMIQPVLDFPPAEILSSNDPSVKDRWDKALPAAEKNIQTIQLALQNEFRKILGVAPDKPDDPKG